MAAESQDSKPSGAAFQSPFDISFEAGLVFSKLMAAVYASLHPVNVLLALLALLLVGCVSEWLPGSVEIETEAIARGTAGEAPAYVVPGPTSVATIGSTTSPLWIAAELMQPWANLFRESFWRQMVICLWGLVVWSWVGTMICRSTALRLGRVDHHWWDVVRFTNQHYLDSLFSILIPLAALAALALPLAVTGWLLVWDWTSIVGAPVAALGSVFGLLMGVILLGLILSWPLMFPAIAFEGRDSFESISRAYAYILQRPIHAFVVAVAAVAIGSLVGSVIELFCSLSASGYAWALSWGANAGNADRFSQLLQTSGEGPMIVRYWAGPLLRTSVEGFTFLARAASYSMFWGLASGIYLLLRRYLDQTPLDEVYRPGLATLKPLDA